MPTKNEGAERRNSSTKMVPFSNRLPRRQPATEPIRVPISTAMISGGTIMAMVLASFSTMIPRTGTILKNELPKSKVAMFLR